jgi:hypothetical protein
MICSTSVAIPGSVALLLVGTGARDDAAGSLAGNKKIIQPTFLPSTKYQYQLLISPADAEHYG